MANCWKINLLTLALATGAAQAAEIFRDDFTGSVLSNSNWSVGSWTKGRTQFGNTPALAGGSAALRFDTTNPNDPGGTFKGTSITIRTPFARGQGMEFEARVRTNPMPAGLLTSFFTYGGHHGTLSDEIDFEFLTNAFSNRTGGDKYSLTSWNDWDSANPDPSNTARRSTATVIVPGLDVTNYNTLLMRWLPDRTEWLVNGQLVRSSTQALPDDPMSVSLNFWAPESSWISAYSANLQPTTAGGSSYFYDLDYVAVRSIPEPAALTGMLATGVALLRRHRKNTPGP